MKAITEWLNLELRFCFSETTDAVSVEIVHFSESFLYDRKRNFFNRASFGLWQHEKCESSAESAKQRDHQHDSVYPDG